MEHERLELTEPKPCCLNKRVTLGGPVGLGNNWYGDNRRRDFLAYDDWSNVSGVALISRANVASDIAPLVRSVEQVGGAAAPLVEIPRENLAKVADPQKLDPQKLREDAAQLREIAENLQKRFADWDQALTEIVKPMFEKAAHFIEVAEAIEQARKV